MSDIIKVYYNPNYLPYNCACYMTYIPEVGMYLSMPDYECFVTDQINFKLDDNSADTYAACRYFNHVVDINSKTNDAIWYSPYDNEETRQDLINTMNKSVNSIKDQNLHGIFGVSNIAKVYFSLRKITKI